MRKIKLVCDEFAWNSNKHFFKSRGIDDVSVDKQVNFDGRDIDPFDLVLVMGQGLHMSPITPSNKNIKYISVESLYDFTDPNTDTLIDFLSYGGNTYLISQKRNWLNHSRAIVDLTYLSLLYTFYALQMDRQPRLKYSSPSNPTYDFRVYLGKEEDKRKQRLKTLVKFFGGAINRRKVMYEDNVNFDVDVCHPTHWGIMWPLVDQLDSKVTLVFESIHPGGSPADLNGYFFTEKLTRQFYFPHPYVLLTNHKVLERLEEYGFKFSYTNEDFVNVIRTIQDDVDGWIEKNKGDFYHNQSNFYKMINSMELPHHLFLDKIIRGEI